MLLRQKKKEKISLNINIKVLELPNRTFSKIFTLPHIHQYNLIEDHGCKSNIWFEIVFFFYPWCWLDKIFKQANSPNFHI